MDTKTLKVAKITRLIAITDEHTGRACLALQDKHIKGVTIRKGTGSCRFQMYVTSADTDSLHSAIARLEEVGFSLDFILLNRAYMNWIIA